MTLRCAHISSKVMRGSNYPACCTAPQRGLHRALRPGDATNISIDIQKDHAARECVPCVLAFPSFAGFIGLSSVLFAQALSCFNQDKQAAGSLVTGT